MKPFAEISWISGFRGATAYELQIYRFGVRWVHLSSGGWFKWWAPWRRLSFQWFRKDQV